MSFLPDECSRCGKEASYYIMSRFNTQMICFDCEAEEKQDPRYEEAKKRELEEVEKGNYNFKGIGL